MIVLLIVTLFLVGRAAMRRQSQSTYLDTVGGKWTDWARQLSLTDSQRTALAALWDAFKSGKPPKEDPFASLSDEECKSIKYMCSMDARQDLFADQKEWANEVGMRIFFSTQLESAGFRPDHAQAIIGMITASVGRTFNPH